MVKSRKAIRVTKKKLNINMILMILMIMLMILMNVILQLITSMIESLMQVICFQKISKLV